MISFDFHEPKTVEYYLYIIDHIFSHMFCVGPVKLFGTTGIWVLDCVLVTMVTIIIAYFMNRFSSLIIASMNKKSI